MATGIKIWDENGILIVGPGTAIITVLGVVDTGTSNGSVSDSAFAIGTPAIISMTPLNGNYPIPPAISQTSTGFTWTFQVSGASYNNSFRIIYGVY